MIFIDERPVFSGDKMLNEINFDVGDATDFLAVALPIINSTKQDVNIYSGHGMPFSKKEWNGGIR